METTVQKTYDGRGQFIEVVNHHTEETRIFDNLKRISMIDRELSRLGNKRRENPFLVVSSIGTSMQAELLELRKARLVEQNRELDRVLAKKPPPQGQMIYLGEERPPWRVSGARMAGFASLLSRQHQLDMTERQLDEIDNRESSLITKVEGLRMELIPENESKDERARDDIERPEAEQLEQSISPSAMDQLFQDELDNLREEDQDVER